MAKNFKTIILIFILVFSFPIMVKAKEYSNYNDLIENSKSIDNSKITLKGEAIGEAMNRGKYTWVNISDGSTAMGMWIESEAAKGIKNFGKYGYRGDIVEINGTFNRACKEHGGDMDVHAISVKIIEAGGRVATPISNNKKVISLMFAVIALTLIFLYKIYTKSISK